MRIVIRQLAATNRLVVPVPVESLLRQEGWRIVEMTMPLRLEASTLFDYRQILINDRLSSFRQRFALAHELIHAFYHQDHAPRGIATLTHGYHDEMEAEANSGAAELLLPYEWFMDMAATLVGSRLRTDDDLRAFLATPEARRWAGKARVTTEVLRYHLEDLGWVEAVSRNVSCEGVSAALI